MVKHTQTIRRQIADKLSVFDHFVGLSLKGLRNKINLESSNFNNNTQFEANSFSSARNRRRAACTA